MGSIGKVLFLQFKLMCCYNEVKIKLPFCMSMYKKVKNVFDHNWMMLWDIKMNIKFRYAFISNNLHQSMKKQTK